MDNYNDLYLELAQKIVTINEVKWIDLWHNQINFLDEEHPFPSPAVFLTFRTKHNDLGIGLQEGHLQIEVYLFYDTFSDTYIGSINQGTAMDFTKTLSYIAKLLHGSEGSNYSEMSRRAVQPVDTGSAGNLYKITFTAIQIDSNTLDVSNDIDVDADLSIVSGTKPTPSNDDPLFTI